MASTTEHRRQMLSFQESQAQAKAASDAPGPDVRNSASAEKPENPSGRNGGDSGRSLVSKLAEVMAAVHRIPKAGRNEFHGYNYATESDIVEAIRGELAKRSIMLLPQVSGHERFEVPSPPNQVQKSVRVVTLLKMTFIFHDGETQESMAFDWLGSGEDGGDKGVYKAMTGAEKYFLMKTFLIPTGDDPETDEKQPAKRQRSPESASALVAPSPIPSAPAGPATDDQGRIYVRRVDQRPTRKQGVTRFEVTLSTGETLSTIKEKLAAIAKEALAGNVPVRHAFKETSYGLELGAIELDRVLPEIQLDRGESEFNARHSEPVDDGSVPF